MRLSKGKKVALISLLNSKAYQSAPFLVDRTSVMWPLILAADRNRRRNFVTPQMHKWNIFQITDYFYSTLGKNIIWGTAQVEIVMLISFYFGSPLGFDND